MISYIATQGRDTFRGGFAQCVLWARERIAERPQPVRIAKARGGERNARVVAEIAPEGERVVADGRVVRARG